MEEILVDSQRRGESLQSSRIRVQDNITEQKCDFFKCDNSFTVWQLNMMAFKVNLDLILLVLLLSGKTDLF